MGPGAPNLGYLTPGGPKLVIQDLPLSPLGYVTPGVPNLGYLTPGVPNLGYLTPGVPNLVIPQTNWEGFLLVFYRIAFVIQDLPLPLSPLGYLTPGVPNLVIWYLTLGYLTPGVPNLVIPNP